jgi:hypothetical protein
MQRLIGCACLRSAVRARYSTMYAAWRAATRYAAAWYPAPTAGLRPRLLPLRGPRCWLAACSRKAPRTVALSGHTARPPGRRLVGGSSSSGNSGTVALDVVVLLLPGRSCVQVPAPCRLPVPCGALSNRRDRCPVCSGAGRLQSPCRQMLVVRNSDYVWTD